MIYQKASTGFRIGASVGMIILMLGIAIALSVAANAGISDQMKIITNFNVPLEKAAVQISNIQKNQDQSLDNAIKFLRMGDTRGFQVSEDEFHFYENLMTSELIQSHDLVNIGADALPQEYTDSNLILIKIDDIERLNSEYEQSANSLFVLSDWTDRTKLNELENDLKNKENSLGEKQNDLLSYITSSYQNIETSIDGNKQRFLMLEIVIIVSA
ncbi:MAG: hypothetical protein KGL95_09355, partial [Patescibacteria group bacterium]|nr:hypothetical protein [Patescibacteria group bacterium]